MRLTRLQLVNFRGFEDLTVDLHPELTLLIGANGAGKTALIDGLARAVRHLAPNAEGWPVGPMDIRTVSVERDGMVAIEPRTPCMIRANADADGQQVGWYEELTGSHALSRVSTGLIEHLNGYQQRDRDLPVLGLFAAGRVAPESKERNDHVLARTAVWDRWWRPDADFAHVAGFLRRETYADVQRGTRLPHLEGVRRAICACVGVRDLWFDIRADEVRVQLEDGRVLPLEGLSDGYRGVISVVAVLAWRAAIANPHHGADAPSKSPGVVLIDEVDLHLHPGWQRRVLGDLRRTFPRFQFVVTTHSPQVVASARSEWVRVLDGATARSVEYAEGRDTNALLEDLFGVSERPEETRAELAALFDAIDAHDQAAAEQRLETLERRLGPDDGDLVRARWLLRLETT